MKSKAFVLLCVVLFCFSINSCQEKGDNSTQISKKDSDESHYYGMNCMDCHYSAGPGDGWFTLAGSANGNGTVELYTGPNGTGELVDIIDVDRLGNFYSTAHIDFSSGLYTGLRNNSGRIEFMEEKILYGQCNLCHGTQEETLEFD